MTALPPYYFAPDQRCLFRIHASVAAVNPPGQILCVQEAKPESRGKWNLPGGHVDHGESIAARALRETREETGVIARLSGLVGVYAGQVSARFVFRADVVDAKPQAGDEILAVQWMLPRQILNLPDEQLVSPANFRQITRDLLAGKLFPLDLIFT